MVKRTIPSTGEQLPVIGLGTWQVFDVTQNDQFQPLRKVLDAMSARGAKIIDSSPMYGRAEEVVGSITKDRADRDQFFYATKVWTTGKAEGIAQMEASMHKMGRIAMDLIQVHNLVDWKTQLATLREWKAAGKVRYIGITHYTDEMHNELEKIISATMLDFVQFNYSVTNRHAEKKLLPAAIAHGVATIINRPLEFGGLMNKVKNTALPEWCKEYNIHTWGQYFLKYIVSHPGVTSVIPATSNPEHMAENIQAGHDIITDRKVLDRMVQYIETL